MSKQTVLVTGGASGIGYACASLLLQKGFRVILLDRDADLLGRSQDQLSGEAPNSGNVEALCLDLSDVAAITAVIPTLQFLQDGLAGLVSNAAVEILKPAIEFTREELDLTWTVNVLAPITLIQKCYPYLKQQRGCIVHIGSTADSRTDARYSIYGGSKAFMTSFVRHAAQEFGFDGVRINTVSPGATETPLLRRMIREGQWTSAHINAFQESIPMEQRFASAKEIAEVVYFALTGPRYLHGEDLRVDGGQR